MSQHSPKKEGFWRRMFENEQSKSYLYFHDTIAVFIILSVVVIVLESVKILESEYRFYFYIFDLIITGIFFFEYLLRIGFTRKPLAYMISTFGIIDLLSFLPSLIIFLFPAFTDLHSLRVLRVIRILRLLRLFRILKLITYNRRMRGKHLGILGKIRTVDIEIYLFTLFSVVTIAGTLVYLVESGVPGTQFTNIPQGMWWAIVTVTTVGYGDMVPVTVLGKIIAAITMVSGLSLFALLITVIGKVAQVVLFGSPIEEEGKLLSKKKPRKKNNRS